MRTSATALLGLLLAAQRKAQQEGTSVRDVLLSWLESPADELAAGKQVAKVDGDGLSITYAASSPGPSIALHQLGSLLRILDTAEQRLISQGIPSPTDDQLVEEAKFLLQPMRDVRRDYRLIRQ